MTIIKRHEHRTYRFVDGLICYKIQLRQQQYSGENLYYSSDGHIICIQFQHSLVKLSRSSKYGVLFYVALATTLRTFDSLLT